MVNQYGIDGTDPVHAGKLALVTIHMGSGAGGNTPWGNYRSNTHYSITSTPHVLFDGVTHLAGGGLTIPAHFNDQQTAFLARRAISTDVTIDLNAVQVSGLQYEVTANVCIEAGGAAKSMRVFIVQDLDWWPVFPPAPNNYYRNGFREPASSYTGSYEDISLNPGECEQVVKTLDLNITGGIEDNIKLVAWAQEPTTGVGSEVYQAAITGWPFMADCNGNGIADECDISCEAPGCTPPDCGTSDDCNANGAPDECELASGAAQDCQSNGVLDECDITFGTSEDCNVNDIPDECEPGGTEDCNSNGTTDLCDIFLGNSQDCQPNLIPDECDIATGTSIDCTGNTVPDECETDCNDNGVRDDCDIDVGTSGDCNSNGRPDECDVARCDNVWNGFNSLDAELPLHGLDYNGDGIAWDNPEDTGKIFGGGCEDGSAFDKTVQIEVDFTLPIPEDGYATSEYFLTDNGALGPDEQIFSLSFRPKVFGFLNPENDWQVSIHDATNDEKVALFQFSSTTSTMTGFPGFIVVEDPLGGYIDTGVEIALNVCYEVEAVLDNALGTVEVYVDGQLRASTTRLELNAHRMDYVHIQPVANGGPAGGGQRLRIDYFDVCLTGGAAVPPSEYDCNGNGVLDECDIATGFSADCNWNGVPDECETLPAPGDYDDDGDVDLDDYEVLQYCLTGPDGGPLDAYCGGGDFDCDGDLDLVDFAGFQAAFGAGL